MRTHSKEWFDDCLKHCDVAKRFPEIRKAAEEICIHYAINGVCDPGYISNTLFRFGRDNVDKAVDFLIKAYGCNMGPGDRKIIQSLIENAGYHGDAHQEV